jgi:hypothetical protein
MICKFNYHSYKWPEPDDKEAWWEMQPSVLEDCFYIEFAEVNGDIEYRWSLVNKFEKNWFFTLRMTLAVTLGCDERIPLGYLIDEYVERCPNDLRYTGQVDIQQSLPDEWRLS